MKRVYRLTERELRSVIKDIIREDVFDDDDETMFDMDGQERYRVEWDIAKRTEFHDPMRRWEATSEGEKEFDNEDDAMDFYEHLKEKYDGCRALILRVEQYMENLSDDRWETVIDCSNCTLGRDYED